MKSLGPPLDGITHLAEPGENPAFSGPETIPLCPQGSARTGIPPGNVAGLCVEPGGGSDKSPGGAAEPWKGAANLDCPPGGGSCHHFPGSTRCLPLAAGTWEISGENC